ncbi:unnamed protein product [Notodromas monacha]|uniref:NADH dehydrogenase [ubiquinone] 1 alpha subcomplex subunit 2 n=1 Tax=Notodromas monacha TaxID=399045 RepID=A0A7R9BKR8_9CRUS|nr:unnamed protein product [Notodromas monacha]CAG0917291.1 unnamed protein product [Notodromas monacha]
MASAGVKFGGAVREVRIHLCQKCEGSKGVRDFLTKDYVGIKKANPNFPILVRECSGVVPKIWARFDRGKEKVVVVDKMTQDQVKIALISVTRQ